MRKNLFQRISLGLLSLAVLGGIAFGVSVASASSTKILVTQVAGLADGTNQSGVGFSIYSGTDYVTDGFKLFSFSGVTDSVGYHTAAEAAILQYGSDNSLGITAEDIIWGYLPVDSQAPATHSFTTGTGATGFQVSASHDSEVRYNVTIATTATIAGGADGTVVLEMAPTNSATAGDWVEVGRFRNGQAISLALTLQSIQTTASQLTAFVPKGYYLKLRTINNVGTPTYTYNSGQEVLK